jgi:hypothetical protein
MIEAIWAGRQLTGVGGTGGQRLIQAQPVPDHHGARGDGGPQIRGEQAQELLQLADVDGHHDLL